MDQQGQDNSVRDEKGREFVSLLTAQQARIYSYILSMVPRLNDADDILQETTGLMWEKFDSFEHGTDFLAWGKKFAYYLVLDYYRKKKKRNEFYYDHQLIAKLDRNFQRVSDSSKDYQTYLKGCVKKLKGQDRKLLQLRYFENHTAKNLASRFGCSVQYVYRNISRIHQLLLACIQKQVAGKEQL
ncbi:RNA polymerase sigma factor RpoE [Anaerohalosphaera lusitana]|uniref:RNA polymerase sigma factor RpoE n=1 Tax=Anaerohalosphaera lusitana TaxID=1936003 RepID=A0A1U9NMP7_9BACT|nr:sigma-70 family RNA polymerase sigma factor [Anaerohalosphaera lusitana]AQT69105.1 RNA polymerase sigma factor RpoE [Anaerohalosphaera lusitana]